jgi:aminoglycoside phosphotransferase
VQLRRESDRFDLPQIANLRERSEDLERQLIAEKVKREQVESKLVREQRKADKRAGKARELYEALKADRSKIQAITLARDDLSLKNKIVEQERDSLTIEVQQLLTSQKEKISAF